MTKAPAAVERRPLLDDDVVVLQTKIGDEGRAARRLEREKKVVQNLDRRSRSSTGGNDTAKVS